MTDIKVDLPTNQEQDATSKERERILILILKNAAPMASDYRHMLKPVGGLMTSSMVYAYSKGIQDVLKLITKETK